MVVGDRHYKHTDEGPVKNVRRNRSPPRNAEDGSVAPGTSNNDSADGKHKGRQFTLFPSTPLPPQSFTDPPNSRIPSPRTSVEFRSRRIMNIIINNGLKVYPQIFGGLRSQNFILHYSFPVKPDAEKC